MKVWLPLLLCSAAAPWVLVPRRLVGEDIADLQPALEKAVKPFDWTVVLESSSSIIVQTRIGSAPQLHDLFEVAITKIPPDAQGKIRNYLVVSNLAKSKTNDRFARFGSHRIFARQIMDVSPGADAQFLARQVAKIQSALQHVLSHSVAKDYFEHLKTLLSKQAVQNVVMVERGGTPHAVVCDLLSKASGKLVAQATVYSSSDSRVGVSLAHFDDESVFSVPRENFSSADADIIRVMADKQAKAELKLDLEAAREMLVGKIQKKCPEAHPTFTVVSAKDSHVYMKVERSGQTTLATKEASCPFVDSDVYLAHFTHGQLQFIHLAVSSRFVREEFMTVNHRDKLDANLEKALELMRQDVETALKSSGGQEAQEKELKAEDLKAWLGDAVGESPVDEPFSAEETANCSATGNKCQAKWKFPEKQVTVALFANKSEWVLNAVRVLSSGLPVTLQITLPIKNSGDQKPGVTAHLKELLAEQRV